MKQAGTPAKRRQMGRPPLHLKPVPVRLSEETLARIEKIAGKYGRPKFVREAVAEKLDRVESELRRREPHPQEDK